ncbi:MAG: hypothetical protein QOI50_3834, partial [Pseudonocardiales bacterium]|nr:hypothetical protein [Pseudonocardiales bacterium]
LPESAAHLADALHAAALDVATPL